MVKLVTTIRRRVAGRDLQPGDEFEVDDSIGRVLVQSGQAEALADKPKPEAPAAGATKSAAAMSAKTAEPAKASTEVKPMTLGQGPNPPPGDYDRRDLKAKE